MPTTQDFGNMTSKTSIWRRSSRRASNALETALYAHVGLILKTAGRVLGNAEDAEDVAQDIAEKLLRAPPKDVKHWPALLKKLAVNRSIDKLRTRRATEPESTIADIPSNRPQPQQALAEHERAEALRRAVAMLNQRAATLFSLCYLADMSHAEIAAALNIKENAVGVALHRVRKQLARLIRQDLKLTEDGGTEQ